VGGLSHVKDQLLVTVRCFLNSRQLTVSRIEVLRGAEEHDALLDVSRICLVLSALTRLFRFHKMQMFSYTNSLDRLFAIWVLWKHFRLLQQWVSSCVWYMLWKYNDIKGKSR
jgi:hypothetical protein